MEGCCTEQCGVERQGGKFLVKKDELPYDSCCIELSSSLHPQPHKSFLHAEGLWTNEPEKRKDILPCQASALTDLVALK